MSVEAGLAGWIAYQSRDDGSAARGNIGTQAWFQCADRFMISRQPDPALSGVVSDLRAARWNGDRLPFSAQEQGYAALQRGRFAPMFSRSQCQRAGQK